MVTQCYKLSIAFATRRVTPYSRKITATRTQISMVEQKNKNEIIVLYSWMGRWRTRHPFDTTYL